MESGQCLEDIPGAKITKELCLQPMDVVAKHVLSLIQKYGTIGLCLWLLTYLLMYMV